MRNRFSALFFVLALAMLVPGLTYPVLSLKTTADNEKIAELAVNNLFGPPGSGGTLAMFARSMVDQMEIKGTMVVFEKTRSVLGTMTDLMDSGHYFTGFLIGFFAVVVPSIKLILIGSAAISRRTRRKLYLFRTSSLISKWSMSDVFVMAIFTGYLAANAEQGHGAVQTSAALGPGFYFFSAYCLLSIASAQLLDRQLEQLKQENRESATP